MPVHDALLALIARGAGLNALENDRYDVVMIASVTDNTKTRGIVLKAGTSPFDGSRLLMLAEKCGYT